MDRFTSYVHSLWHHPLLGDSQTDTSEHDIQLTPAITAFNHSQHHLWISSHDKSVLKIQAWPYWLQRSSARTSKSELACTLRCHMLPGFCHLSRARTDLCLGQISFVVPECFESSNTGNGQCIIWITEKFLDNSWADRHSRVSCHCVSLCVFIPAPLPSIHFSPSLTGGGGRQWQGSLNHKTPAGHRSRQPPHKITNSLSTSKWTGPVCHTADVCVRMCVCVCVGWGGHRKRREGTEGMR